MGVLIDGNSLEYLSAEGERTDTVHVPQLIGQASDCDVHIFPGLREHIYITGVVPVLFEPGDRGLRERFISTAIKLNAGFIQGNVGEFLERPVTELIKITAISARNKIFEIDVCCLVPFLIFQSLLGKLAA